MPDPKAANDVRQEIKDLQRHNVAEERALMEADQGAELQAAPPDLKQVANEQGTRVWNQWDDEEAKKIADTAAKQAESEEDDGGLVGIRATSPADDPEGDASLDGPTGPTGATGPSAPTGPSGVTSVTGVSGATAPKRQRQSSSSR